MDIVIGLILTGVNVVCVIICTYHTKKQTEIQNEQLQQSKKPGQLDRSTNDRLQAIAIALQKIEGQLKVLNEKAHT